MSEKSMKLRGTPEGDLVFTLADGGRVWCDTLGGWLGIGGVLYDDRRRYSQILLVDDDDNLEWAVVDWNEDRYSVHQRLHELEMRREMAAIDTMENK